MSELYFRHSSDLYWHVPDFSPAELRQLHPDTIVHTDQAFFDDKAALHPEDAMLPMEMWTLRRLRVYCILIGGGCVFTALDKMDEEELRRRALKLVDLTGETPTSEPRYAIRMGFIREMQEASE